MKTHRAGRSVLPALLFSAQLVWAQGASFDIAGFRVDGNSLLPAAEVQALLAPFAGTGRGMKDVEAAAEALRQAYADAGYPVVKVFPPEQTLSGGQVALRVVEGKIRTVTVVGNKEYDAANIRASLPPLKEGLSPKAPAIVAAITLANENPAKQVAVNFQSGATAGDVDARIDVTEDKAEKTILNYDNAGSKATGYDRLNFAYQNANIGNLDHMLTLQYGTTVAQPDKSTTLTGGYRIPFYEHGFSLDLIGSYSNSQTNTTSLLLNTATTFTGRGTYVGARVNQALPNVGQLRHKLSYGIDYKDFANACATGGTANANCGSITAMPASATYAAQYSDPAFQAGGSVGYFMNIPGGMHGAPNDYAAARTQASRHWDALRAAGFVAVPLAEDWQLRAAVGGQLSGSYLVPAEQFGIGGASSVRGYDERSASGDYGFAANVELYTPDVAKALKAEGWQIRGLVFVDSGAVYRRNTVGTCSATTQATGCTKNSLASIGVGVRASLRKELSVKFDIAWTQRPWIDANPTSGGADTISGAHLLALNRANGPGRSGGEASAHIAVSYSF